MGSDTNDPFSNLTRMWMEMAANAMQAWQPMAGSTASPDMFRKGRSDFLQVWSDWCEQLLRSSAFLEAQKQCMSGSLAFRKQIRANLRRMQRELQIAGREDIDALVAAVQRSQRRVLDQLEETSERLQALEAKLDRLGERLERFMGAEDGAAGRAATAKATAAKKKKRHEERLTIANARLGRIMNMFNGGGNVWLEAQKALVDEWMANARRAAALPRIAAQAQRVQEGGHALRSRLRRRPCEAAPLPGQRAGEARNAPGVRLRAGQPPLHSRHLAQQERRRALRQGRLRHLPDRLGHGHRRRSLPHAGRLYQRLPAQRRAAGPQALRRREGQPAGILHGRHDERDVHRLAPAST